MPDATRDEWARAFAAAMERETRGPDDLFGPLRPVINCADLFGPIDWDQIRWDQFAGKRPPIAHVPSGNGRSWRWTRRARVLGWSLLILAAGAVGYFAYLLPWVRNP